MPKPPAIFGISMADQKSRRRLVVLCYALSLALIFMPFIPGSRIVRFILGFFTGWWICLAAVFYKLAKDTVLVMREDLVRPVGLGLLSNAYPGEIRPDERQVAVRNAAYYKAYRIVAQCSLLMPILFLSLFAANKALLGMGQLVPGTNCPYQSCPSIHPHLSSIVVRQITTVLRQINQTVSRRPTSSMPGHLHASRRRHNPTRSA